MFAFDNQGEYHIKGPIKDWCVVLLPTDTGKQFCWNNGKVLQVLKAFVKLIVWNVMLKWIICCMINRDRSGMFGQKWFDS